MLIRDRRLYLQHLIKLFYVHLYLLVISSTAELKLEITVVLFACIIFSLSELFVEI